MLVRRNELKFRCGECGRSFVSKMSYLAHVNRGHTGALVGRVCGEKAFHEVIEDDVV